MRGIGALTMIVDYQVSKYFKFLRTEEDYESRVIARYIAAEYPTYVEWDLIRLGNLVSRYLYHLARDFGWTKMTSKQREKFKVLPNKQWQRQSEVNIAVYQQSCLSEATLCAARTGRWSD